MSQLDWLNDYSVVGSIQKPHGVRGEVKVKPEAQSLDRLQKGQSIFLANPKTKDIIPSTIDSIRVTGDSWIIKFDQIKTREQVPEFRFFIVLTPFEERPELEEGHFYYSDLEGLDIIDSSDQIIGQSIEVLEFPSVESISAKVHNKNILIPWIDECVLEIDLDEGFIRVDLEYMKSVYDI